MYFNQRDLTEEKQNKAISDTQSYVRDNAGFLKLKYGNDYIAVRLDRVIASEEGNIDRLKLRTQRMIDEYSGGYKIVLFGTIDSILSEDYEACLIMPPLNEKDRRRKMGRERMKRKPRFRHSLFERLTIE